MGGGEEDRLGFRKSLLDVNTLKGKREIKMFGTPETYINGLGMEW